MPTVRCTKCGKRLSICVIPYQRIHRDKITKKWVPSSDICVCDPEDIGVFGLIKKREEYDAREREKEAICDTN